MDWSLPDGAMRGHRPVVAARRPALTLENALVLIFVLLALAGIARLGVWAASEQVSFDGAMNLEVARSLAEGNGYQRMYADRSGFSHEIQSRAPLIVPAAAVFAGFGVGVWQSQLTNLLYAMALVVAVFLLVRRCASWHWGVLAVAVCVWTPGIRTIALGGYGEVPALVWWLAALFVLFPAGDAPVRMPRAFAAGLLIGVAMLTKTVLAIGLVAVVPVFLARWTTGRPRLAPLLALVVVAGAAALPLIAHEIAHAAALGDTALWHAWLYDELHAIHMQAGTADGFRDTHDIGAKLLMHSHLLADSIGMPIALLPLWIAGPLAIAFIGRRGFAAGNTRALLLTVALFAAIYFLWWLGFTPTEKAWYRRIFNGVLALQIVLVIAVAGLWRMRDRLRAAPRRIATAACIALVALQIPLARSNVDSDEVVNAASRESLESDLAALRAIAPDATIYGAGWFSAPVTALYSGRHFGNIATKTPDQLVAASPILLVLDTDAQRSGALQYWIDRYAHRDIASSNTLRIVELDARVPSNPFVGIAIDDAAVRGRADFHRGDYAYTFGFQGREGDGWQWATADVELLLRYGGEPQFNIDVYLPALKNYRFGNAVGVTVWLNGCRLGTFHQDESRRERWWFPTANCPLQQGQIVTARLTSDNVYQSRDDRQLGYIVHALGFAAPESAPADAATERR